MRQLIVNADGFGFTFGNNKAILEVLEHGFIRSVSVNVTWPAVDEVRTLVKHFPDVNIGVHWNLSVGPPILTADRIPSLVNCAGEFHGAAFTRHALLGRLELQEMCLELRAQLQKLRDLGVDVTHWDSHQGRHLYPGFFQAAMTVAREEVLLATRTHQYYFVFPDNHRLARVAGYYRTHPAQLLTHSLANQRMNVLRRKGFRMPDRRLVVQGMGFGAVYRPEVWQVLLETLPDGCNFIECHPGYPDDTLKRYSNLTESRQKEAELFHDPAWTLRAEEMGIVLSDHRCLP